MTTINTLDQTPEPYCTSGTSPTRRRNEPRLLPAVAPSPTSTVHLLGPGQVGLELLALLVSTRHQVIAISDSQATVYDASGLDVPELIAWKRDGRALGAHENAHEAPDTRSAVSAIAADTVVDTTATRLDRDGWARLGDAVLARGARYISAAKDALCWAGPRWLTSDSVERLGIHAVLGGTGHALQQALPALRAQQAEVALAGNASTTTIIETVERGATFSEGLDEARRCGVLEPDPELDLRGVDAAIKLAIVAGVLGGRAIDPRTIDADDLRDLDPRLLRWRAARGLTTRLIGRWRRGEAPRLRYEAHRLGSALAVPPDRVAYHYRLRDGSELLHSGAGLGARATAEAVLFDLERLAAPGRASTALLTGGVR